MSRKHKCCICDKEAKWYNSFCNKTYQKYYCDEHVPRNCINNVDNLEDFGEPKTTNKIMWWDKKLSYYEIEEGDCIEVQKKCEGGGYIDNLKEESKSEKAKKIGFDMN